MTVNLITMAVSPEKVPASQVKETVDQAAEHAATLDSLIDGEEDGLGGMLIPIRDFLRELAGYKVG
jgi:Na+-transporting NADH:ubiquinone oxidoreductase subunit NqrD